MFALSLVRKHIQLFVHKTACISPWSLADPLSWLVNRFVKCLFLNIGSLFVAFVDWNSFIQRVTMSISIQMFFMFMRVWASQTSDSLCFGGLFGHAMLCMGLLNKANTAKKNVSFFLAWLINDYGYLERSDFQNISSVLLFTQIYIILIMLFYRCTELCSLRQGISQEIDYKFDKFAIFIH